MDDSFEYTENGKRYRSVLDDRVIRYEIEENGAFRLMDQTNPFPDRASTRKAFDDMRRVKAGMRAD
jgi:hypothetical protein